MDRVVQLSQLIQEHADKLSARVKKHATSSLSLESGVPEVLETDTVAIEARRAIDEYATELQAIVKGPQSIIMAPAHNVLVSIHIIVEHGIAEKIPVDGDGGTSFAQLAELCNMDEDTVKRVMRHACARFIFKEQPKGVIKHNAASRYLAGSSMMRQFVGMTLGELWPAASKLSDALRKWPGSGEPNNAAFNLAHSTDLPGFQWYETQPIRAKRFGDAMTWFSMSPEYSLDHLVNNHDFGSYGKGLMVDVGGSHGTASLAVQQKYPDMKCIVQDLTTVVNDGSKALRQGEDRISFAPHDFFTEQPVKGANVYLLRHILHDWSDKYAAQILKALVPALTKDSTILIMERILPEPGQTCVGREFASRSFDLAMLALANGKERDIEDWEKLLKRVDEALTITDVTMPPGSALGLIQVKVNQQ